MYFIQERSHYVVIMASIYITVGHQHGYNSYNMCAIYITKLCFSLQYRTCIVCVNVNIIIR